MKKGLIVALIISCLGMISCGNKKESVNNTTVESNISYENDYSDYEDTEDTIDGLSKDKAEKICIEKVTNLTEDEKSKVDLFRKHIEDRLSWYKDNKIEKAFIEGITSNGNHRSGNDTWMSFTDTEPKAAEAEKWLVDNTNIEILDVFKSKDFAYPYTAVIKIKTPDLVSTGYKYAQSKLVDKPINETFKIDEYTFIDYFKQSENKEYFEKVYMLTANSVDDKIFLQCDDYIYDAVTGNMDSFVVFDNARISNSEPSVKQSVTDHIKETLAFMSEGNFDEAHSRNYEGIGTSSAFTKIEDELFIDIIKYMASKSNVEVLSLYTDKKVESHYSDENIKYISANTVYQIEYPDFKQFTLKLALEGKSVIEIRDAVRKGIETDSIPAHKRVIKDIVKLSEDETSAVFDGTALYTLFRSAGEINQKYLGL